MRNFIFVDSWFHSDYAAKSSGRYPTFRAAINLWLQNGGGNIVETGTTRLAEDWGAGYSTMIFGSVCKTFNHHLWTVDIDPRNIETCKVLTANFADILTYVVDDSHNFLKNFNEKIALLYLDSVDFPLDGSDPLPCQQHQLNEFKLAEKNLTDKSIVLLDDNDFPGGGKTRLTKNYLFNTGWRCVLDLQQSLWIK